MDAGVWGWENWEDWELCEGIGNGEPQNLRGRGLRSGGAGAIIPLNERVHMV